MVAVDIPGQSHGAMARQDDEFGAAPAPAAKVFRAVHPLGPLLHRLGPRELNRNDLAMIGRVTSELFPEIVRERLTASSETAATSVSAFLTGCGNAIAARTSAPSFEVCERELAQLVSTLTGLRWIGPMRELPDDVVGRIFGLAFSLEQLERNLKEFVDRINELAADAK